MAYTTTVTEVKEIAPGVLQLTLAFADGGFRFAPGQYVTLKLGDRLNRAYSIASAPERPDAIQLCIRIRGGDSAGAIRELKAGDTLTADGPYGEFLLPEGDNRPVVFLAGDSGVAPVRSIVLHMQAVSDRRTPIVLVEPLSRDQPLFDADFRPLADAGTIVYERGAIEPLIAKHANAIRESIVMISGFETFLHRVRTAFEKAGLEFDKAIIETYD